MPNRIAWWILVLAALVPASRPAPAEPARGDVVLKEDFDGTEALKAWAGADAARIEVAAGRNGSSSLWVRKPAGEGPGGIAIRRALPLDRVRGARVKWTAWVKAEDVAAPPKPWNGIKVMLHTVSPAGPQWAQKNGIWGTFDWKPVEFAAVVPPDATEAWLVLGLEATTGRVGFDDVRMTVAAAPRKRPAAPPPGPAFKGHDLPRLRGAMISTRISEADLRDLAAWGANHVRWQLTWGGFPRSPADSGDLAAYDRWLEETLRHVDRLLPLCRELGLLVLIDLHTPPGGRDDASDCRLFQEKRFQDRFLALWEEIAKRYRDSRVVWGYDLVNEPVEGGVPDGVMDWQQLALEAAKRVRAIDPKHAIVVEPAPWGDPASLDDFEPLSVPGVVYSVHMYKPHHFTHQGVYDNPTGLSYPGSIDGKAWGKEQIRLALKPAREFQRDTGAHLYVGEFSAIRWAPGESARDYLRDVIDVMEEHGWDWAYHAFREWDGWSVEHGSDPKDRARAQEPTSRLQLLRSWFAKNVKPVFARE